MPARGNVGAALHGLRVALDALVPVLGSQGGRGGRQRGKGGQKGRQRRQRDASVGDLRCGSCGAYPVYSDRTTCFRCGEARSRGSAKGKGRAGQAVGCPTHRVPGSSMAAGMCMAGGRGGAPEGTNSSTSPPMGCGALAGGKGAAKGYSRSSPSTPSPPSTSRPWAATAGKGTAGKGIPASKGSPSPAAAAEPGTYAAAAKKGSTSIATSPSTPVQASPTPTPASGSSSTSPSMGATAQRNSTNHTTIGKGRPPWADTFDDEEDNGYADQDDLGEDGDDAGTKHEDVNELHRTYLRACSFLRKLKKGTEASSEVIDLATRERDEAEERWRAAKPPVRTSVRLARASASLDKAFRAKEAADEALADFDARTAAQRSKLLEDQARARERIALHQSKVDDLRAESGTVSAHTPKPVLAACRAARVVGAGLGAEAVPRLQAALESLESSGADQSACGELNLLLRDLQNYEYVCRKGYDEHDDGTAECYDIGDYDCDDLDSECDTNDMADVHDHQDDGPPGGESHEGTARSGTGEREQPTRWARQNGGTWKKSRLGDDATGGGAGGSSSGTPPTPGAGGAGAAASPTAPAASQNRAEISGREAVGATPGELQAMVQERQSSGDWAATQAFLAQQETMAAEQRRLHRALELAEAARCNGIHLDPAASSWSLLDLETWAKENGMQ